MLMVLLITKMSIALITLLVFFLAMFIILRCFDWLLGVNFKEAFNKIEQCPKSMALYYGLRWLGTALAMGVLVCVAFVL